MVVPAAAKKVVSAAESMGFTVITRDFTFHKAEVLWASTKDGHTEGDVRTPAKKLDGCQVIGYRTEARLGFDAIYAGGFQMARILDPVGTFRDLKADYSITDAYAKSIGYTPEHAQMLARRRDAEYNDGAQLRIYEWFVTEANKEFYPWIDEWLKMLKSEHPPITPKPRATKEEKAAVREKVILDGGEWSA